MAKRKSEPTPFKVYTCHDREDPVYQVRLAYYDGMDGTFVVEGRVRNPNGRPLAKWDRVAGIGVRSGNWYPKCKSGFLDGLRGALEAEMRAWVDESSEWIRRGWDVRNLIRRKAIENGTWSPTCPSPEELV